MVHSIMTCTDPTNCTSTKIYPQYSFQKEQFNVKETRNSEDSGYG